ncbi:hypothetical protein L6164_024921 [Bauhinia variegata]|uniref:Uncharacterized protein n=1 Tax=Bauhinia variegata TaxID=167791 RepID=A0ACB9LZ18_BAUVA|nr:hypothetical protein L6164_024921 [Bauhinia variegata]
MANEGASTSNVSAESSDSTVQLNIKTLDSRIYSFQVDKNMPVSLFKEKIANEIGVPVNQQRLIFRGKVLKDDHVISEYHVENGHTLHLVERQPNQLQASGTSSVETTGTNGNRGNDATSGAPRNRVGQISHSVVLGTFNVGEQGESIASDLTRVIGAVLNSIGIGGQSTNSINSAMQSSSLPNLSGQAPVVNEAEGMRVGNQNQAGNQSQSAQTFPGPFQSLPQVVQIPLAAGAIPVPSLNAPIPDSLHTLSEFINRMERTLSQNGYQPNLSSNDTGEQQVELSSNVQGLPTPEALSSVLRQTERLLNGHAVAALSHIAGHLEREGTTSDPSVRGQIQSESMQMGIAMQHLGSLLLELGRTILTLRMGQSAAESVVNAGPAVYISPSGPNPIMVQPFPLQTNSLFGGSVSPSSPATFGGIGIGTAPRNINIHIHAGTSLAPIVSAISSRPINGEATQGEQRNGPGSGDLGSTRVLPVRNVVAAAVPSRPPGVAVASGSQTGLSISTSQPPSDSVSLQSVLAEVNSRLRNFAGNLRGDSTVLSGQVESTGQDLSVGAESRPASGNEQLDTMEIDNAGAAPLSSVRRTSESRVDEPQLEAAQTCNNEGGDASSKNFISASFDGDSVNSSRGETISKSENGQEIASSAGGRQDLDGGGKAAPLGLGLTGLERKRRSRLQPPVSKGADGGSTSSVDQNQQARIGGQHILQALASHGSAVTQRNAEGPSQGSSASGDGQVDVAGVMSQVLHSPALNGLLAGVSQQTGVGSPDVFRNMLQQFTQSPQMRNSFNHIIQQVGSQDMGNIFAGMERGQGGGIDLSRMFQQMMPIVSEALGSITPSQSFSAAEPESQAPYRDSRPSRVDNSDNQSLQINVQPMAGTIEGRSPPAVVFRAVAENAVQLSGSGSTSNALLEELCCDDGLASEYVEMLRRDLSERVNGEPGPDKC